GTTGGRPGSGHRQPDRGPNASGSTPPRPVSVPGSRTVGALGGAGGVPARAGTAGGRALIGRAKAENDSAVSGPEAGRDRDRAAADGGGGRAGRAAGAAVAAEPGGTGGGGRAGRAGRTSGGAGGAGRGSLLAGVGVWRGGRGGPGGRPAGTWPAGRRGRTSRRGQGGRGVGRGTGWRRTVVGAGRAGRSLRRCPSQPVVGTGKAP